MTHDEDIDGTAAEFVLGSLRGMMLQRLVHGGDAGVMAIRRHVLTLVRRALAPTG